MWASWARIKNASCISSADRFYQTVRLIKKKKDDLFDNDNSRSLDILPLEFVILEVCNINPKRLL